MKYVYIGRKICGCVAGIVTDEGNRDTSETVAEFITDGLVISRVDWKTYREKVSQEETFMNCPHGQTEMDLGLDKNEELG